MQNSLLASAWAQTAAPLSPASDPLWVQLLVNFHWADNAPPGGDIRDWWLDGDSAPNGRFNYRYANTAGTPQVESNYADSSEIVAAHYWHRAGRARR